MWRGHNKQQLLQASSKLMLIRSRNLGADGHPWIPLFQLKGFRSSHNTMIDRPPKRKQSYDAAYAGLAALRLNKQHPWVAIFTEATINGCSLLGQNAAAPDEGDELALGISHADGRIRLFGSQ
jgi:hypothetical protein